VPVAIPPLLDELLRAPGPSGFEERAAAIWREAAAGLGAEVSSDTLGSSFARLPGTSGSPLLAIVAHVDEVGFQVSHVDEGGFVWISDLSGKNPLSLVRGRVQLLGPAGVVPGVVGRRGREDKVEWEQLYVDIGARDRDEALALVRVGDPGCLAGDPVELAGGRVASKALDNRSGTFIALEILRLLAADPAAADVVAIASVQEESGHQGAQAAAFALEPDVAIVLDVTYAVDVPDGDPRTAVDHRLGGGPALFRGPAVHPKVFALLEECAAAEGLPWSVETGSKTMTDADGIHPSRAGVPTGLVSLPLRQMHSAIETAQLSDLEACARLVAAFARRLEPGVSFER